LRSCVIRPTALSCVMPSLATCHVYFLFQSLSCVMCAVLLSSVIFFFPAHSHGRARGPLLIGANILGFAKGINEGGIYRGVLIGY
jgi:hypothetical protein